MTDFCQHVPMSRLFETQNSRGFIDPTLRSLCGVIEIQPLRGCKKSVFYQTRAITFYFLTITYQEFENWSIMKGYINSFLRVRTFGTLRCIRLIYPTLYVRGYWEFAPLGQFIEDSLWLSFAHFSQCRWCSPVGFAPLAQVHWRFFTSGRCCISAKQAWLLCTRLRHCYYNSASWRQLRNQSYFA